MNKTTYRLRIGPYYYVGESQNPEKRWYVHQSKMQGQTHDNKKINAAWLLHPGLSEMELFPNMTEEELLAEHKNDPLLLNCTPDGKGGGDMKHIKREKSVTCTWQGETKTFDSHQEAAKYYGHANATRISEMLRGKLSNPMKSGKWKGFHVEGETR